MNASNCFFFFLHLQINIWSLPFFSLSSSTENRIVLTLAESLQRWIFIAVLMLNHPYRFWPRVKGIFLRFVSDSRVMVKITQCTLIFSYFWSLMCSFGVGGQNGLLVTFSVVKSFSGVCCMSDCDLRQKLMWFTFIAARPGVCLTSFWACFVFPSW